MAHPFKHSVLKVPCLSHSVGFDLQLLRVRDVISVCEVPLALVSQLQAYVQHQGPCPDVITNSLLVSTGQSEDLKERSQI